jgi:hypothetical protein
LRWADGCYDENGALYRLLEVIVVDLVDTAADDNMRFSRTAELVDDEVSNSGLAVDMDSDDELDKELEQQGE